MFLGRESQVREIEQALAAARAGSSGSLVIVGDAGIGKSALLARAGAAAGDMIVLRMAGSRAERDLPFAGLASLLRPIFDEVKRIPEPQALALGRALALVPGQQADRFAIAAATLSMVCRAAEDRPVLVLVDDLQDVDRPSAEALLFLARRLLTDSVAVLIAMRPDPWLTERVGAMTVIALGGLAPAVTAQLVRDRGLNPRQLDHLSSLSGGNPLAILEMAAYPELLEVGSVGVPVPILIAQAFASRTTALSAAARLSVQVAAAAGDLDLATIARVCGRIGAEFDRLEEAEQAGIVTIAHDQVRFQHPLLRATVYQSADPHLRRDLHRAIAAALPDGDTDRRAWHLSEGSFGPDDKVATILSAAASSARVRGAYAVAARNFERAAELSSQPAQRCDRLIEAGESAWLAGQSELSTSLLEGAEELATDRRARSRAIALRGVVAVRSGSILLGRDLLIDGALGCVEDDPAEAVRLLAEAVYACFYLGDVSGARAAVALLERATDEESARPVRWLADLAVGMGLILADDGETGAERIRRSVDASSTRAPLEDEPRWLPWLVLGPLWLRESGPVRDQLQHVVDEARDRAAIGTLPFLLFHTARDHATTSRWGDAEASYREAIALGEETGQRNDATLARCGMAWLAARQGSGNKAQHLIDEAEKACLESDLVLGQLWLVYARGDLAAGLGQIDAAAAAYAHLQSELHRLGIADPDLSPGAELVQCLVLLGDRVAAQRQAADFDHAAERKGQSWVTARAKRSLAVAGIDPVSSFERALDEHLNNPDVYEQARTQLAYGEFLRRRRQPITARDHLRAAVRSFDLLGATPWADRASFELAAAGEPVQRRAGMTAALTSQEYQIAGMLAGGKTTREAAAALFLSPKTVEYHLRHVYIKLGISSRAELKAALVDESI